MLEKLLIGNVMSVIVTLTKDKKKKAALKSILREVRDAINAAYADDKKF